MKKIDRKLFLLTVILALLSSVTHAAILYSLDANSDRLVTINTTDLSITDIGPVGVDFSGSDGMSFTDSNNLYASLIISSQYNFYKIDPDTGSANLIQANYAPTVEGMSTRPSDGTLFISYNPSVFGSSSTLGTVNLLDGTISSVGSIGIDTDGLAFRSDGDLFGEDVTVSGTPATSQFYQINPSTGGVLANLGTFSSHSNINGISFDESDTLFGLMNSASGTRLAKIPLGNAPVDLGQLSSNTLSDLALRPIIPETSTYAQLLGCFAMIFIVIKNRKYQK